MDSIGNFLGTLTGLGFGLALLNYPVKWINKRWISKLPKDSSVRQLYLTLMKWIVKNHRYFALAAAVALVIHLTLQITFKWVSSTGLIAAGLLISTVLLGAYGFVVLKGKRGKWLNVHQLLTVLTVFAILVHDSLKF